jgi:hypothetical protein
MLMVFENSVVGRLLWRDTEEVREWELRFEEHRACDVGISEGWQSLQLSAVFRTVARIDILLSKGVAASAEGTFETNYIHYTWLKALPRGTAVEGSVGVLQLRRLLRSGGFSFTGYIVTWHQIYPLAY